MALNSPVATSSASPAAHDQPSVRPFFENKARAFWTLQAVGWSGYLVQRSVVGVSNGFSLEERSSRSSSRRSWAIASPAALDAVRLLPPHPTPDGGVPDAGDAGGGDVSLCRAQRLFLLVHHHDAAGLSPSRCCWAICSSPSKCWRAGRRSISRSTIIDRREPDRRDARAGAAGSTAQWRCCAIS